MPDAYASTLDDSQHWQQSDASWAWFNFYAQERRRRRRRPGGSSTPGGPAVQPEGSLEFNIDEGADEFNIDEGAPEINVDEN